LNSDRICTLTRVFGFKTVTLQQTIITMAGEDENQANEGNYDEGQGGMAGAPMPLGQLEGINGLTNRDIKLFIDAGFHTVESIAYTYVSPLSQH
jgi:hypothetical protein